jgi:YVTN family beta-propeller protein
VGGPTANVEDADDECILVYQRLPDAEAARHVSVDADNNVWVGGYPGTQRSFHKLANATGAILDSFDARDFGCGGYGGLIDGAGILWSASIIQGELLRYNPVSDTGLCIEISGSYGLGLDTNGFVWNSMWTSNSIVKVSPAGVIEAGFPKPTGGFSNDRGVAVTPTDNHVWVANSGGNDVSRLDNDGNFLTAITVGSTPTGVAVDADGKVWVTNLGSDNVMRIDPATNSVDLTVDLGPGAGPYNYSDMTGTVLFQAVKQGTWDVVYNSGIPGTDGCVITWNQEPEGTVPDGTSITVEARAADDETDLPSQTFVAVMNGADAGVTGQFVEIKATLTNDNPTFVTPVLSDLTITCNQMPDCSQATPSIAEIWPPNHKFVSVSVLGVTDPDGDPITIIIDSIFQDEPVDTFGDGSFTPDGQGVGTDTAEVRAERTGTKKVSGNGRVYHIYFTADDGEGESCSGEVLVGVPHDQGKGKVPIDDGALFDSTALSP